LPAPAPLRLIKRCKLYERRGEFKSILHVTRGLYVLYRERTAPIADKKSRKKSRKKRRKIFEVVYIGVAGVAKEPTSGIGGRLKGHDKNKPGWTHYSLFEAHDNVGRDDILELEGLLLRIFRHDPRIQLANKQLGGKFFKRLSGTDAWK
jgi:hypothetical protein